MSEIEFLFCFTAINFVECMQKFKGLTFLLDLIILTWNGANIIDHKSISSAIVGQPSCFKKLISLQDTFTKCFVLGCNNSSVKACLH